MMLNIVNKSPFERNALDTCLRLAKKGADILLIEDAVYAAQKGTAVADKVGANVGTYAFYVMGPDLQARALDADNVIDGVTVIDYDGFVDLVEKNDATQSWL